MTDQNPFTEELLRFLGFVAPQSAMTFKPVSMTPMGPDIWFIKHDHGDDCVYYSPKQWEFNSSGKQITPKVMPGLTHSIVEVINLGRGKTPSQVAEILPQVLNPRAGGIIAAGKSQAAGDLITKRIW